MGGQIQLPPCCPRFVDRPWRPIVLKMNDHGPAPARSGEELADPFYQPVRARDGAGAGHKGALDVDDNQAFRRRRWTTHAVIMADTGRYVRLVPAA